MEKVKEIELLQSLKGDTYFAQLFGDEQIDAMCENIRNDFPIERGLNLFEGSLVVQENAKLKSRIAELRQINESVAKFLLVKAREYGDDTFEDLAEHLIGYKKRLAMKLSLVLPLDEDDRDTLAKLLME